MVQHYPALNRPAAPVCSVCIANYNGVAILADCIDSVLQQRGDLAVEITIHDDASTDDSVAFLRAHYPQVELLVSATNVGFCIGNNRMVAHARGDFVLLLNNDAALYPDALASLLAAARNQQPDGILTLPQYDWQTGNLVDHGCLLDPFYNPVPNLDPDQKNVAYAIGACLFLSRTLWIELGGFPEWIGSIGEDMYLCCLGRLRGLSVAVTPGSGYRHRQGASFGGNRIDSDKLNTTFRRRALSERNKTAVMVVCTPTLLVWPLLAVHAAMLLFEGLMLSVLRRDTRTWTEIYAPAIWFACRAPFVLLRHRREMQARRCVTLRDYLSVFTWMPQKLRMLRRHGVPTIQ